MHTNELLVAPTRDIEIPRYVLARDHRMVERLLSETIIVTLVLTGVFSIDTGINEMHIIPTPQANPVSYA
jgi:hypothetical protein